MIFLVGARRSGTNWLERLIAAHSQVTAIPGETYLFSHGIGPLTERFHHGARSSPVVATIWMQREPFLDALREFCDTVFLEALDRDNRASGRLLERTPWHVRALTLIADIYPDASVINLIRDGRDVARSLVSMDWGPATMREAAAEWKDAIDSWNAARPLLSHATEVRYEEALADTAGTARQLFEWLGLDAGDAEIDASVTAAGRSYNADTRSPALAAGKWRTSLSPEDLDTFMEVAGATLVQTGYTVDERQRPASDDSAVPRPTSPSPRIRSWLTLRRSKSSERAADLDGAVTRDVSARMAVSVEVTNELLDLMTSGSPERLRRLLGPGALVHVVTPEGEWRDADAADRLARELAVDSAFGGRQLRGDVFPGVPSTTVALAYEGEGAISHRLLVATVTGRSVTGLDWYRLD